ncbi:hypothetical protein L6452_15353 [Arctium lappa]|uniref:Uncharacterized protein n=1 Tax=Arctium lappa TaxID=4217 RepID=A0ACB9CNB4_ARCLA|nr:hypothetical protein L6452_15353 [Arctium lappa]
MWLLIDSIDRLITPKNHIIIYKMFKISYFSQLLAFVLYLHGCPRHKTSFLFTSHCFSTAPLTAFPELSSKTSSQNP